jgi:hypothetical protein
MFGTFCQVVELEKQSLGLQRPIIFNQILYSTIHESLPPKSSKCPSKHTSPPQPSLRVTSSPQKVTFCPFQASRLACRGWVRSSKVSSRPPKVYHYHPTCGPGYPNCGLQSPRNPKVGLFFQNCRPTRYCKDK